MEDMLCRKLVKCRDICREARCWSESNCF